MKRLRIFYCHGMSGGQDSRIPSVLASHFSSADYLCDGEPCSVDVTVRTYSFDPDIAQGQIKAWADEIRPDLVIGESLGSAYAVLLHGMPHLYVSPAMKAPKIIARWSPFMIIPGVRPFFNRMFRPTRPNRQIPDFTREITRKYAALYQRDLENAAKDYSFAFIGSKDHYLKWGVVDIGHWAANYGDYQMYPGSHFMEQEFLESMLIPKICEVLHLTQK